VLLGPTGAGKTTTLRLIAGLERPDRGNVLIQGRTVTDEVPAERDVAFVFQQYSLYPHLTVYDNLAFPLRSPARRMDDKAVRRRVQQVSELLHIEQKLGNPVHHIHSGRVPESVVPLSYGLLLNLVSLPGLQDKDVAWKFVQRYAPNSSPESDPDSSSCTSACDCRMPPA